MAEEWRSSDKRRPYWLLALRQLLWYGRSLFSSHITIKTKQGIFTVSTQDAGIGASLYRHGHYEYYSSLEALQFLKHEGMVPETGPTMLDIGANIGIISIGLLNAGEISKAVAIEPEPATLALLKSNISQNNLTDQIKVLPYALGDREQTLTLEVSRTNKGDHRIRTQTGVQNSDRVLEQVEVQAYTLPKLLQLSEVSNFLQAPPSLVWIDVQGFEGFVFRGAAELLKSGIPTVAEVWPHGIISAGMSLEEFEKILSACFDTFYQKGSNGFEQRPISEIEGLLQSLHAADSFTNILLVNQSGKFASIHAGEPQPV